MFEMLTLIQASGNRYWMLQPQSVWQSDRSHSARVRFCVCELPLVGSETQDSELIRDSFCNLR